MQKTKSLMDASNPCLGEPEIYWENLSLLMTVGRSGSSMVAGIFKKHGLWTGPTTKGNVWNPDGYFENQKIKQVMFKEFGREFLTNVPDFKPFKHLVFPILESQGCDGPWLFKTGAQYYKCFNEFSPKYIKIKRDKEAIFNSYKKCKFLSYFSDNEIKYIINRGFDIIDTLEGPEVHYEKILKRNYGELKEALQYCDLTFDQRIVDDFVRTPS